MKNRSLFFLLVANLLWLGSFSQTLGLQQALGQFVPASPQASAIASYQNYPVDYMTGNPQISIPLLEINTKMGKLPIQLSYSLGKIKNSELTGPVGFGWTLTPNLGISRAVHGVADDVAAGYGTNTQFGNQSNCLYLLSLSRDLAYDEQPDDFYYSLLNKSGRFIYRTNKSFSTIPFEPLKISHPTSQTFSITDADGTIYNFGKYSIDDGNNYIESTRVDLAGSNVYTAWKITDIISFDKTDTIKFIYNPTVKVWDVPFYTNAYKVIEYPDNPEIAPKIYQAGVDNNNGLVEWQPMRPYSATEIGMSGNDPFSYYDVYVTDRYYGIQAYPTSTFSSSCNTDYGSVTPDASLLNDHYIEEMPLTDIIFRGGKLSMTYNGTQVNSVVLYSNANGQYTQVKRVDLYQHSVPFTYQQPVSMYNLQNNRYLLDSVLFKDGSGTANSGYRVKYKSTQWNYQTAPPLAAGLFSDMFGFPSQHNYLGIPALPLSVSSYPFCNIPNSGTGTPPSSPIWETVSMTIGGKQFYGATQTIESQAVPDGIISQLTYPTGGAATFTFESNYFQPLNGTYPLAGGGFRIKNILYTSVTGSDSLIKSYRYGANESGAGVLRYEPQVSDFMSTQITNTTHIGDGNNQVQRITMINGSPHKNITFGDGAAVLYPVVTEYLGTPTANSGKTIYSYNISELNTVRLPNTPLQYDYRDDWRTTSLSNSIIYKYTPAGYFPVKRMDYAYKDTTVDAVQVGMAFQQYVSLQPASDEDSKICSSTPYQPAVSYLSFMLNPGKKLLQQVTETTYDPDDSTQSVQVAKSYTYDPVTLQQLTEIQTNSKNQVMQTSTWYPGNAGSIAGLPASQQNLFTNLLSLNRINIPIRQQSLLNGSPEVTVMTYFSVSGNGIYPSQIYTWPRNNAPDLRIAINQYDRYGNVLEQQKANDVKEVYFWGYNGLYPVAKVLGADYATASPLINQSVLDNPATTDAQMRAELDKLRSGLPNALVESYTYKPLVGITSHTNPAGLTDYYEYDSFNQLMLIRDKDNNVIKTFEYHYKGN